MRVVCKLLILLLVLLFVAVSPVLPGAFEQKVAISGSSTVMPLAELIAEEFNILQDDYRVSVRSGGTGVGIVDMVEGRSDIAMASREIHLSERQRYDAPSKRLMEIPVGFDAICLVVSSEVYDSGVTSLTKDELKQIYAGDITNWEELGGPNREMFVIGRKPGSGTRDTFVETIMGSREAETPGTNFDPADSSEVKMAILRSDNAIGYVGFSYIMRGDTKVLSIDGIQPTIESIKKGNYTLARKLYFITLGEPKPGAKAFIDYVLSPDGQKIAIENGFIPA